MRAFLLGERCILAFSNKLYMAVSSQLSAFSLANGQRASPNSTGLADYSSDGWLNKILNFGIRSREHFNGCNH